MMRFVRDFGRMLLAMLLINLLLIWLLGTFGVWGRWASQVSAQRDEMRGGVVLTDNERPLISDILLLPTPQLSNLSVETQGLEAAINGEADLSISARLLKISASITMPPDASTHFLPNDSAFDYLPTQSVETLLNSPTAAASLLNKHVVASALSKPLVSQMDTLTLASGGSWPIRADDNVLHIGNAGAISAEIPHTNGFVHKIDRVLLPNEGVSIDTPDGTTEIDYNGTFITINGSGQANMLVILHDGQTNFGNALVNTEGRWSLSGNLHAGRHEFVAYLVQPSDRFPLAASVPIILTSE
ncbi:MAG: fasciclin domain-containing protein [Candidatus Promineifilaceae bacterium]